MALSTKDLIDNIAEVLNGADGEYVAQIYNQICSDKVKYQGDSLFERIGEVSDDLKNWAGNKGWSVMEADDLPGMWDWTGPDGQACSRSFDSDEEAWADLVEQNELETAFAKIGKASRPRP